VGLTAWKAHITGDAGSIEVNPSLNADYMPTNALCAGMGIQFPLKIDPTGIVALALKPEASVTISDGILSIESQVAETVQGYSITGALLFNIQKPDGKVSYSMNQPKGVMILLRGSSGWTKKITIY
jgi:hypothetical protein